MANVVELRDLSDEKLEKKLEDAREALFNLRFRRASNQLEDYTQLKTTRREIAQLETVLHGRKLAVQTAVAQPEIAAAIAEKEWAATARFDYEKSAWRVQITDAQGKTIASATVDLNKKRPSNKKETQKKGQPKLVTSYDIAG